MENQRVLKLENDLSVDVACKAEDHESCESQLPSGRKGIRFVLAFIALSMVAFTSALDATIIAIALPVRLSFDKNE